MIADPQAGYFGAPVDDQTLVAGDGARVGTTRFEDWLSASKSVNP